jgi:hypothetical protein
LRNYWTSTCPTCPIKPRCTTGKERRVKRREHEAIIDAMERRLDQAPDIMRIRRQTVEHPFGTIKACAGSFRASRGRAHARAKKARVSAAFGAVVAAGLGRRRLKNVRFGPVSGAICTPVPAKPLAGVARNGGFWRGSYRSRPRPGSAAWFLAVRFWGVDRQLPAGFLKPHL